MGNNGPSVNVLASELATGLSYTRMARVRRDSLHVDYAEQFALAREAFNKSVVLMEGLGSDHPKSNELVALLQQLGLELSALDSRSDGLPKSPPRTL